MVKEKGSEIIEQGDIFFFYRPKVDTEEVEHIKDVQRFYMITSPEKRNKNIYRLFLIGQKQLPEIVEGRSTSKERNWALNVLTTSNSEDIRRELLPAEYITETRGKRRIAAAVPVGEGKYCIVKHDNHTELAYILELPKIPGPTQREFEIKKEASYIISVKNPDVTIPGYAAFSTEDKKPNYPKYLRERFGDRRWIDVEDPDLLNYENTQVLLIGARKKDVKEELGIEINEQRETDKSADMFKELKIRKEQVPLKPLLEGKFPGKEEIPMVQEVKHLSKEEAPGRGGKMGGRIAATKAPSAAAIAKLLSGIDFPKNKSKIIDYAEKNKEKLEEPKEVINTLKEIPDRRYYNMADVEKALGEIR
jgi:Protein of unknown function (DUF2795)